MRIASPKQRPRPFKGARTHARLRHDYATWHEEHVESALAASKKGKLPFEDRSRFDSFTIIDDAIGRSEDHIAQIAEGSGNFVICFDMGYDVGYDASARRRTSVVTVVISPIGEVVTVYPGKPKSA